MRAIGQIQRRLLVRVLAIAQFGDQRGAHHPCGGEGMALIHRGKPLADRRIIAGGEGIGLGGKSPALLQRGFAPGHQRVIGGVGDDGDMSMVLRGATHHAGPADVDILDDVGAGSGIAGTALGIFRHRLRKGIEVHHHQIDRANVVLGHGGEMLGIVAHGQQAAMHLGVQRLHAAIHHFGKTGEVGNVAHRQTGVAQSLGRAAGRDQIHTLFRQRPAQLDKARLVRNRKQGAADGDWLGHGGRLA